MFPQQPARCINDLSSVLSPQACFYSLTSGTERDGNSVCSRLGHLCGSGHAQEPLALRQRKRVETDVGFVQDVVRETAGRGAAAGHQELPPPVRVTPQGFCSCVSVNSRTLPPSSDCLLSDAESSSSDGPVADKRAPGSERAAERAAQQNERERIRLVPQSPFTNMQVGPQPASQPASRQR